MDAEKALMTAPWFSLALIWFVFPVVAERKGLAPAVALSMFLAIIFAFAAGLFWFETIFPPPGGIDCSFCQAIGEMIAISFSAGAIGIGMITVWKIRRSEDAP